jgi:group II intron reverse transcriptase/maturase
MNVHVVKPIPIDFKQVVDAYGKVKRGGKATGIDRESWSDFEKKLQDNLYVIWNRLASGTYFPSAVREVEIPKKDGKTRKLGIPTLRDRIAQEVVRKYMEQRIDHLFHVNSYGYRPLKSASQAIEEVRQNCKTTDWVIDLDISKFFDEISHELMLKAVAHVIEDKWVSMYVKRWLEMKIVNKAGEETDRGGKGTPQGGVISPLLANLYLHFALDKWLEKKDAEVRFVRYADDMVIHCRSKEEAEGLLEEIKLRLQTVALRLNEQKTQIVYCKDYRRTEKQSKIQFGFLGFSFQPRRSQSKLNKHRSYTAFTAEISKANQKKIAEAIKTTVDWRITQVEIQTIAEKLNSRLRGWINYFGLYGKASLRKTLLLLERRLVKWIQNKYKIKSVKAAFDKLFSIKKQDQKLFYHWEKGYCFNY